MTLQELFIKLHAEAKGRGWNNTQWAKYSDDVASQHLSNIIAWSQGRGALHRKGTNPTKYIVKLAGSLGYEVQQEYVLKEKDVENAG